MKRSIKKVLLIASMLPMTAMAASAQTDAKYVFHGAGNPYLPLWEHIPDGEPRVFADPDNPGKQRVYIIGSHDLRYDSYCGPDIHMWSAPVEDLSSWRDEGAIFTYKVGDKWDVMYAPDLVEVNRTDGTREYYLYPHSRGWRREAMVCKGSRPDGPFTPINLNAEGTATVEGSCLGFDPSIYVEQITDPNDPDYDLGYRAYGYWGFQRSSAAQLDPNTMYSVRPGTEWIPYFMPAGTPDGGVREPEGTEYPALFPGEKPGSYNFFEASSIRKIGNKYVTIYSGYSGPEYGMGNSNSTLRYAYADSPLGPWKSGGVLVDSRAPMPNEDGSKMQSTNGGHNTHGSIEQINGQWYVFYHRPPRNFGGARQAVVAPIHVVSDTKPVAKGGKVVISAFSPYEKKGVHPAKDANGNVYTGAEVTSEGFHVYGLDPYCFYPAGIACYLSDTQRQSDAWDVWDNNAPVTGVKDGNIIGYKYFGFGGLEKDCLGLKAFEGTKAGNNTMLNLYVTPKTNKEVKINVWLDGPWDNKLWNGKKIGEVIIPANSPKTTSPYTINVSEAVDKLDKKHAIYLVAECEDLTDGEKDNTALFDLIGLGFSCDSKAIAQPIVPKVKIMIDGTALQLPTLPTRSTNINGYTDSNHYDVMYQPKEPKCLRDLKISAKASNPDVKIEIGKFDPETRVADVKCTYDGQTKVYHIHAFQ